MDIRLLGPVELWHRGRPLALGPQQQRCLLTALAVPPGRSVSAEVLTERVWGRQFAGNTRNSLYTNLSKLRRVVEGAGGALRRSDSGYLLVATEDDVDLYRARRLAAEAQRLAGAKPDGAQRAVELLREADALWRATPLADLRGDWAERLRQALSQERLAIAVQRYELELGLGQPDTVVNALAELHAEHPLAESVTALLMRALWRSGQQAAALQVFAAARQRVIDELGVEPSAQLRRLHQQLLRGEAPLPEPAGGRRDHRPGRQPGQSAFRPAQLPPDVAGFTGRRRELAKLDRLSPALDGAPVTVIISGAAGVGKTALAVRWAHGVRDRFPDGQLYVNLRGYAATAPVLPAAVLARFLPALGVPQERVPTGAEEAEALYRSLLADRRVLVVLDNAIRPDHVRPLLPSGPGSMALVTSRTRLDGLVARDGARPLRLAPLTPEEARQLLARVIGQRVEAEPEATAELAELCGHLPLALRIAAANVAAYPRRPLADYVRRLRRDDRLAALAVPGDPDSAVAAAFDLSYARLPPAAQRMFRLLGLVPGPDVTAAAAAVLAGIDRQAAEGLLDALATAHLVEEHAAGRYALLDPLRRYAANRAAEEEPAAGRHEARERLFDYYLRRADAAARLLYPQKLRLAAPPGRRGVPTNGFADHAEALAWLDEEATGLVAAVKSASVEGPRPAAWLLADALRGYFEARRVPVDWLAVGQAALAAAEAEGDLWALAFSQLSLADAHAYRRRYRQAITFYQRALSTSSRCGSRQGRVDPRCAEFRNAVLNNIGVVTAESGLPRRAARYFSRALALSRAAEIPVATALQLGNLGEMYVQMGRLRQAVGHHVEALAIHRKLGNPGGEGAELCGLARAHHALGEFDLASSYLTEALPLARLVQDRVQEFSAHYLLAVALRDTGRPADDPLDAALRLARDIGDDALAAAAAHLLGTICHERGDHREAIDHQRQAATLARRSRAPYQYAEALIAMAAGHRAVGDQHQAHRCLDDALSVVRRSEYRLLEGAALTVLADLHLAAGDPGGARAAGEQAAAIHRRCGHRLGQARAHLVLGCVHARTGDHEVARWHWGQAHRLFTDLGVPPAQRTASLSGLSRIA